MQEYSVRIYFSKTKSLCSRARRLELSLVICDNSVLIPGTSSAPVQLEAAAPRPAACPAGGRADVAGNGAGDGAAEADATAALSRSGGSEREAVHLILFLHRHRLGNFAPAFAEFPVEEGDGDERPLGVFSAVKGASGHVHLFGARVPVLPPRQVPKGGLRVQA